MKQQKGFAGIELLLLLSVVLVVAGVGAYIYTGRHKTTKPPSASQPVLSPSTGTSTSPGGIPGGAGGSTSPATSPGLKVFKVPEAGLQISLPASLSDLTYHISSAASGTTSLTFSTKSLTLAVPSCSADHGTGAFDTIIRGSGTYQPAANASNGGLIKQYSSYYLAYQLPAGPCAKGLTTDQQNLLDNQAQDFYTALPSVQGL